MLYILVSKCDTGLEEKWADLNEAKWYNTKLNYRIFCSIQCKPVHNWDHYAIYLLVSKCDIGVEKMEQI